jgi:hypothetical protein
MALDIAGCTGVAFGVAGETPRAISVDLGKSRSEAVRFSKMIGLTNTLIRKHKPDLLVYEAPVGGPKTSHTLVGIAACFVGEATRLGFEPEKIAIASVRKHFLGKHLTSASFPGMSKGRARQEIKRALIARCNMLGWKVDDDDQADACAIWDYACAKWAGTQAKPIGGLFT